MTYTAGLSLTADQANASSPEARLDAKLKAMAAARLRHSTPSLLPDLNSLPQSGGRLARADDQPIAVCAYAFADRPVGSGWCNGLGGQNIRDDWAVGRA